ncbi:hypothetical protein ER308_17985 [Egibacter rhizosphaerae]|uniref:Peptidase S8/S53 domain-containing protein n=1 Tax=Egibacter rhizosphaerae TaxID=1670831 RepID=A0A411YIZ9_9ACTN|nr:S8 family serine peptidase [Egibacter rhizosphaerae]QBI21274.1 hypothetical protein ER308_17985 [Egibacter rhizosphaerae]
MRGTHAPSTGRRVLAGLVALAALIALTLPVGAPAHAGGAGPHDAGATEWIVPASADLPGDAEVVTPLLVADALLIRSSERPEGGVAADTPLSWQTADDPSGGEYVAPDSDETSSSEGATTHTTGLEGPHEALETIGATEAWDTQTGGDGLVALIDTGVADIEALEGSIAGEVDFTDSGGGDGYGHGTFMASLIAASGNSMPGIAPDTGILSLKVGDQDGDTDLGTVLAALEWLHGPGRDLGIRVGSLALGVDPDNAAGQLLDIATQRLGANGVLLVTASGNDGPDNLSSPATSPGTLAVGASDGEEFSGSGHNRVGDEAPRIYAPGVEVISHHDPESILGVNARNQAEEEDNDGGIARLEQGLLRGSGTSISTALVAGTAALASAENPGLDGLELTEALLDGSNESDGQRIVDAPGVLAAVDGIEGERPEELQEPLPGPPNLPDPPGPPDLPGPPDRPGPPGQQGDHGHGNAAGHNGVDHARDRADQARTDGQDRADQAREQARDRANEARDRADEARDQARGRAGEVRDRAVRRALGLLPMPATAQWEPAEWSDGGWKADGWAAARWDDPPEWRHPAVTWDILSWRAEDWQGGVWTAADWHASVWTADDWAQLRYSDAWDILSWRGDDWDILSWRSEDWDILSWRELETEILSWRSDDWDILSWRADSWNLIVDE